MMLVPRMQKVEFLVLKADMAPVLSWLGSEGCIQFPRRTGQKGETPGRKLLRQLQECRIYLELPDLEAIPPGTILMDAQEKEAAQTLADQILTHAGRSRAHAAHLTECSDTLAEALSFGTMGLSLRELSRASFLVLRLGRLSPEHQAVLRSRLGGRAVLVPLSQKDRVALVSSRKSRFALDDELAQVGFKAQEIPEAPALSEELVSGLHDEVLRLEAESAVLIQERHELVRRIGPRLLAFLAASAMEVLVQGMLVENAATEHVCRLEGWMPANRVGTCTAELEKLTQGRIAIRIFEPQELASVQQGREIVPVQLRHGPVVRGFESMVVSYGAPLYGTIDPTGLVAFFFVVLFALMFGDMGQGLVILLAGLALATGKVKKLAGWTKFAPVLTSIGCASMVTGLLYGSVFSNDQILVPLSRWITGLFGLPQDRIITLLPTHGIGRLLGFFGFTIGVGVILNSLGLVINMINLFRLGKFREAFFSKTGLSGALFFWYALFFGLRLLLGGQAVLADLAGFVLPLLAMVLGPPFLEARDRHHHPSGRAVEAASGFGGLLIQALVEILESLSYYISNTLSFLRVGAFALSHAVLSLIIFTLGDLVWSTPVLGPFFSALIIILGNVIVLVLEGMIVAIQVIRLQYYEFFSKFFTQAGELFSPFRFEYKEAFS